MGTREVKLAPPLNLWRSFKELTPSGVLGDARKASATKGERPLDVAADLLAAKLVAGEPPGARTQRSALEVSIVNNKRTCATSVQSSGAILVKAV